MTPVRTGYSAIADEWIGIRPGTDGLFVMALIHELLRAGQVDLDSLVRYTNAPWLVRNQPADAGDGLFVRGDNGHPMAWDRRLGEAVDALAPDVTPALQGEFELADGTRARPVFALLAQRYLEPQWAPERVAGRTGVPATTIRRIAAELAHVAFRQQIELDVPWTDWAGRRHQTMIGRPVSMHAMRGISAHSNGFHTCRAIHVLQMLLGTIDCPGGFRHKPPFPRPAPPGPKPAGKVGEVNPGEILPGPPLGFVAAPEDLLVEPDGRPRRIDKAYSWEYPLASHGLMHQVILNAWRGAPDPIDTLFMYMSNMGWNSAMNTAGTIRMLTDVDEQTGEYRIPRIIYSDAFFSETVPYADLVLPDTTYLERYDCISLMDRPISSPDGPADAIRQPVVEPDRDVRPFQDVLIELGARLGLPAFVDDAGTPKYPGGYPDYIVNHERAPGCGPLAGWRGATGTEHGRGAPNPEQLQRYIDNQCFWQHRLPQGQRYFKHANGGYLAYAHEMGWIAGPDQIVLQLYSEPLQKFRQAARGFGDCQPPDEHRERLETFFDPLPIWYPPLEEAAVDEADFPLHAITQRPMAMYHSWGSHNAWLRQIYGSNRLYVHRDTARELGLEDGDAVWIESHHGRVRARIGTMTGCNPNTVWTWNAIGRRRGAVNLNPDATEASKGFLLNHLISELLPGGRGGNADPVTGQAAWFDLRVRLRKADVAVDAPSEPQFETLELVPGLARPPAKLRYGERFLPKGSRRRRNRS